MQDFEKLGVFYLGKEYDQTSNQLKESLVLYDSRDLVTHAVVVGMTGSGKTGLCIDLIEEAAIDGVPSILIDPKGDLANLLLTFPNLRGEDFLPWVQPEDAARAGLTITDYAARQAETWKKGLADWGQDGSRIQRLRDSAEFAIYTPGSSAGIPVSILKSFAVPPPEILEEGELLNERITVTVTSLLGLLNIEADPLMSREHILLSTIVGQMWRQGQDLDLAALIGQIQTPPVTKIGVMDLETFYPAKDRFKLMIAMNNLLASPGFSSWLEGNPLDIDQILHTSSGKPRVAIFSVAHLGDAERMFFVSLLLNQFVGWMRTQPGTTSLRALFYMDEIFGYFPPVNNPPSKQPLLTLLKQARAYGVGVILATQNPVDLDYKGLANTGTWFIGRLQTERDKGRVMDGLEGAAASTGASFDRAKMEQLLAGLDSRVFLMNNTHDDQAVIFKSRWCLAYLSGPLTRNQIKLLSDASGVKATQYGAQTPSAAGTAVASVAGVSAPVAAAPAPTAPSRPSSAPAPLAEGITQFFVPLRGGGSGVAYAPMLAGAARVHFMDAKTRVDTSKDVIVLTPILNQVVPVDWAQAKEAEFALNDLEKTAAEGASFDNLPSAASQAKSYLNWTRDFTTWVYGSQTLQLQRSPSTGQVSKPDETERDFRVRLQQVAREERDQVADTLRKKYAPRIAALQEKVRKAQLVVDRESAQAKQAGVQAVISVGATLLGAFMGGKLTSRSNIGRAATAARGFGRTAEQSGDIGRAKETLVAYQQQLKELNEGFEAEAATMQGKIDPSTEVLETLVIRPKKTDINVQLVALVWAPFRGREPAW